MLLTYPDRASCGVIVQPCDVSAKIGFAGGKIRLTVPIPYVAPFFELGVGLSVGTFATVTPTRNLTYDGPAMHVPVTLGLAVGPHHELDLSFAYLVHTVVDQVDGAVAVGFSFPLR